MFVAQCKQCSFKFSAPASDLETFIEHHLRLATDFRLSNGFWKCGHCHSTDKELIEITTRPSYQLHEGEDPAWVIIDTRGHWSIENYIRDKGPHSKKHAMMEVESLNRHEGYNRWIVVRTGPATKTLRRNPYPESNLCEACYKDPCECPCRVCKQEKADCTCCNLCGCGSVAHGLRAVTRLTRPVCQCLCHGSKRNPGGLTRRRPLPRRRHFGRYRFNPSKEYRPSWYNPDYFKPVTTWALTNSLQTKIELYNNAIREAQLKSDRVDGGIYIARIVSAADEVVAELKRFQNSLRDIKRTVQEAKHEARKAVLDIPEEDFRRNPDESLDDLSDPHTHYCKHCGEEIYYHLQSGQGDGTHPPQEVWCNDGELGPEDCASGEHQPGKGMFKATSKTHPNRVWWNGKWRKWNTVSDDDWLDLPKKPDEISWWDFRW